MALCSYCGDMMHAGKFKCQGCGRYTLSDTGGLGGAVGKNKVVSLSEVSATSITRVSVGEPWDECFGGGIVPTSSILCGGAPGSGKDLNVSTVIPTPSGWSTMGDLKPGDVVFDERGEPCNVTYVSPIFTDHRCYRVVFSDGDELIAGADHLWKTQTKNERTAALHRTDEWRAKRRLKRNGTKQEDYNEKYATGWKTVLKTEGAIRTTEQIRDTLKYGAHVNHSIDRAKPIVLPDVELPIDPYLLGVWLGDGTSEAGHWSKPDAELAERIRSKGYTVNEYRYRGRENCPRWAVPGLVTKLKELGVYGDKHIPQIYLRASIAQRLELFRGLMDTDGECDKSGHCGFSASRRKIRDGMYELLNSLGVKANYVEREAKCNGKSYGACWRFTFMTSFQAFTLPRKAERQITPKRGVDRRRYIVAVEPVETVPTRCISVDSPSHLYLAGPGMIPTHNTTGLLQISSKLAEVTGRWAYVFSAEQGPGDIKITADRLRLPNTDRFKVLSELGGGGAEVDEELLKEFPPASFVVDSVSALCGKDVHAAISIAKRYKKYSDKYKAPSFLICHMTKEHDYAGLMALQHEVDTLITIFPEEDGSRALKAWKHRFGSTHKEYFLVMTEHGLVEKPGKSKSSPPPTWEAGEDEDYDGDVEDAEEEIEQIERRLKQRGKVKLPKPPPLPALPPVPPTAEERAEATRKRKAKEKKSGFEVPGKKKISPKELRDMKAKRIKEKAAS